MTLLAILAAISGSVMTFASLPQIYKIYKRKSAKDISAISYSFYVLGGTIWLLYGIELNSYAVILSNSLSVATSIPVLIGYFLYGRENKKVIKK